MISHLSPVDRAINPEYFCAFLQQLHQSPCFPSRSRSEQSDHLQTSSLNRGSPSYLMAATLQGAGRRALWLSCLWEGKAGVTVAEHRPAHHSCLHAHRLPSFLVVLWMPSLSPLYPHFQQPKPSMNEATYSHVHGSPSSKPHPTSPQTAALPAAQLQLAPIVNQFSFLGGLCITSNILLSSPPYPDPCPHPTPSLFSVSW